MASLRKKLRADGTLKSPYWFCRFKDPVTQQVRDVSTKCRIGDGDDLRKALRFKNEKEALELSSATAQQSTRFTVWVPKFLKQHYSNPKTLQRMETIWVTLQEYLASIGVHGPEQLRRQHAMDFITWRSEKGHGRTKSKPFHRNTVILELKLLTFIMGEALDREWIEANPVARLKIERARVTHRGEIKPEHAAIIRAAIAAKLQGARSSRNQPADKKQELLNAHFLHASFEIAMLSGLRQSETHFNLRTQVDFRGKQVLIHAKGKDDFYAPLSPALAKFLRSLIAEGRTWTYERPRMPSLVWFKFMDKLRAKHPELAGVHFHGSRAAVISRLEEAGAPASVVMRMVNHSSHAVHEVYRRVKQREVEQYLHALNDAPAASSEVPGKSPTPGRRISAATPPPSSRGRRKSR